MRLVTIESLPNRQSPHRHLERAKSGRRQNGLICAASILIGIEPVSIQNGGSARVSQELGQSHKVTLIPEGIRLVDMIS